MRAIRWVSSVKNALGRGVFPPELSFFLELPWRHVVLSPRKLVARLGLTNTSHVLEVGAGSGFYSVEVARKLSAGQLELTDLQPEMLRKAQRKLQNKGLASVGYTLSDAGSLPFKEASFDTLFLVAVLGEVSQQKAFLKEAHRVLKPGGTLSISEHLPDPDFSPFAKTKSLVEREGFELAEHYGARWNYTANFRKSDGLHYQKSTAR